MKIERKFMWITRDREDALQKCWQEVNMPQVRPDTKLVTRVVVIPPKKMEQRIRKGRTF